MLPCSVCESRGNFHLVLFESDEQGGDRYASLDMLVQINWFVSEHRQLSLLTIASRYYHEFKQKLFDVVNAPLARYSGAILDGYRYRLTCATSTRS